MYDRKVEEYKAKQNDLIVQMEEHNNADKNFYLSASRVLDVSSRALEIFDSSDDEEKNELLNFLLQNSTLNGKTPTIALKNPFRVVLKANENENWGAARDSKGGAGAPKGQSSECGQARYFTFFYT